MQSLPYPIPGPAGAFSGSRSRNESGNTERSLVDTSVRQNRAKKSSCVSLKSFDIIGWHSLLLAYDLRPYGPELLSSSIALIKSNAFRGDFQRLRLAVRVEKMHFVGLNASVTLADPTGTIVATVLAEVFEDRKCGIQEGAVLMLDGVTALMYPERKPAGFYINLDAALHMSIQSSNIVHIFSESDELDIERKELVIPYSEQALRLPNADQETLRKQRSVVLDASDPPPSVQLRPNSAVGEQFRSNNPRGNAYYRGNGYNRRMRTPQRPSYSNNYRRNPVQQRGREADGTTSSYASGQHGRNRPQHRNSNVPPNQNWNKRPADRHAAPISRPKQRPRSITNSQQYCAPSSNKSTETLTDDQLDDLLGSVDIDAAIAAATQPKTTSSEKKIPQSSPPTSSADKNNTKDQPSSCLDEIEKSRTKVMHATTGSSNNATDTLTDAQLDTLLGSVDMESLLDG